MLEEQIISESPAASETQTETTTESAAEEQQEPQEGKHKGGFQKKIDKLTREKAEAAREVEFWRQQALRITQVDTPKKTEPTGEPSESDFQTHGEYVRALVKYEAKQTLEAEKAAQRTAETQTQHQEAAKQYREREQTFKTATPDFDDVMAEADDVQISNALVEEITTSDNGPALKYYLAKNPDEAARLSQLKPLALAREVGKIEARFTTSEQKTAPKTTSAPPPPTPTGKSSATSSKDPGDMSPSEYRAWKAKQAGK